MAGDKPYKPSSRVLDGLVEPAVPKGPPPRIIPGQGGRPIMGLARRRYSFDAKPEANKADLWFEAQRRAQGVHLDDVPDFHPLDSRALGAIDDLSEFRGGLLASGLTSDEEQIAALFDGLQTGVNPVDSGPLSALPEDLIPSLEDIQISDTGFGPRLQYPKVEPKTLNLKNKSGEEVYTTTIDNELDNWGSASWTRSKVQGEMARISKVTGDNWGAKRQYAATVLRKNADLSKIPDADRNFWHAALDGVKARAVAVNAIHNPQTPMNPHYMKEAQKLRAGLADIARAGDRVGPYSRADISKKYGEATRMINDAVTIAPNRNVPGNFVFKGYKTGRAAQAAEAANIALGLLTDPTNPDVANRVQRFMGFMERAENLRGGMKFHPKRGNVGEGAVVKYRGYHNDQVGDLVEDFGAEDEAEYYHLDDDIDAPTQKKVDAYKDRLQTTRTPNGSVEDLNRMNRELARSGSAAGGTFRKKQVALYRELGLDRLEMEVAASRGLALTSAADDVSVRATKMWKTVDDTLVQLLSESNKRRVADDVLRVFGADVKGPDSWKRAENLLRFYRTGGDEAYQKILSELGPRHQAALDTFDKHYILSLLVDQKKGHPRGYDVGKAVLAQKNKAAVQRTWTWLSKWLRLVY